MHKQVASCPAFPTPRFLLLAVGKIGGDTWTVADSRTTCTLQLSLVENKSTYKRGGSLKGIDDDISLIDPNLIEGFQSEVDGGAGSGERKVLL